MCDVCKRKDVQTIKLFGYYVCEHCYENVYYNSRDIQLAIVAFSHSKYKEVSKAIKYAYLSKEVSIIVSEIFDFIYLILTDDNIEIKPEHVCFLDDINTYGSDIIIEVAKDIYARDYSSIHNISFDEIDNYIRSIYSFKERVV